MNQGGAGDEGTQQLAGVDYDQQLGEAHDHYDAGRFQDAQSLCEQLYNRDAYRTDNLLLLGAIHFQLRNFSECIFYNQQCIRIDPNFAEAFGNIGNSLKELGDMDFDGDGLLTFDEMCGYFAQVGTALNDEEFDLIVEEMRTAATAYALAMTLQE